MLTAILLALVKIIGLLLALGVIAAAGIWHSITRFERGEGQR